MCLGSGGSQPGHWYILPLLLSVTVKVDSLLHDTLSHVPSTQVLYFLAKMTLFCLCLRVRRSFLMGWWLVYSNSAICWFTVLTEHSPKMAGLFSLIFLAITKGFTSILCLTIVLTHLSLFLGLLDFFDCMGKVFPLPYWNQAMKFSTLLTHMPICCAISFVWWLDCFRALLEQWFQSTNP